LNNFKRQDDINRNLKSPENQAPSPLPRSSVSKSNEFNSKDNNSEPGLSDINTQNLARNQPLPSNAHSYGIRINNNDNKLEDSENANNSPRLNPPQTRTQKSRVRISSIVQNIETKEHFEISPAQDDDKYDKDFDNEDDDDDQMQRKYELTKPINRNRSEDNLRNFDPQPQPKVKLINYY
jgi:hypothetical protein